MKKRSILIIMMMSLLLSASYSKKTMAEQDMTEINGSTEAVEECPYINLNIFRYFDMKKGELESWNKIQTGMYEENGLTVANYTLYSPDGYVSQDRTSFHAATVVIRLCEMSEYSKRYPDLFEDITGHREAFVDAVNLRAGDVFNGVRERDTLGMLKSYLQRNVDQFDWNYYSYWTDFGKGLDNIETCRLEFTYNGYLFSIKIREGASNDKVEDAMSFDPNWRVCITNLNTSGDYTELTGTYIQVSNTNNFGEQDPEFAIQEFGAILTITPNSQGYLVKRYCCDTLGRWKRDLSFGVEGGELQLVYSGERGGWTSYYGGNYYYLDAVCKGNRMELMGDGQGVVYKKISRNLKSPVVE